MSAVVMQIPKPKLAGLSARDQAAIEGLVAGLESAWNAGDGVQFAKPFTEEADFVNIHGRHAQGWWAIAEGHEWILRNAYMGSVLKLTVSEARLLRCDVALVHLEAHLSAPKGPLAGEYDTLPSLVLMRETVGWKITSFHDTRISTPAFTR